MVVGLSWPICSCMGDGNLLYAAWCSAELIAALYVASPGYTNGSAVKFVIESFLIAVQHKLD